MISAKFSTVVLSAAPGLFESGCQQQPESNPQAEAPPPLKVQSVEDRNLFEADRPEGFPLTASVAHSARAELQVTGAVNPDVARNVPVIPLATGRIVEIARLGGTVTKGQILMKVPERRHFGSL